MSCDVLEIAQGEDATIEITVSLATGGLYDLTGAKAFFTVKKRWKDTTSLIAKATANAGGSDQQIVFLTQTGSTKGKLHIFLLAADTSGFTSEQVDNSRSYVYDVWLITVANKHKVVRKMHNFQITPSVTRF